ncbi:uncharacterized protein L969DRAFT_51181 [Mixia osmundae IAM 14324]|uniref:Trafficking protein particle complex subunit n=1 Tax=Mixia osmundae (strain CBS 9802 / IAM 14324 / JCM 22182 / KY 12970) TaxID=764103 RepID=G7E7R5_MIXOS|nr:uncharacterized protein L969DRAFT_51181 [Mixia osmundae IAM 14324]KEI38475.1 hypothetical protein L969DRAFT_51181 [Mixia osmundae IAM 14324]GAA98875.1 hypothetical protein E5Q_05563 [Mixia osmundae IAM 14324]
MADRSGSRTVSAASTAHVLKLRGPSILDKSVVPVRASTLGSLASGVSIGSASRSSAAAQADAHLVALASWQFLFSAIISYSQNRVTGIAEFERKLSALGYRVGARLAELLPLRESLPISTSRTATGPTRQTRLLPLLLYIHTQVYKYLFGAPATALEKSTENQDEYMITDNDPILTRSIEIPKDMSQLSCMAFMAGLVEAICDGGNCQARVTAHSVPTDAFPRRTVLLVKLDASVMEREAKLG